MEDLYISPDYRGQGAGRALLKPLPGMRLRAAADARVERAGLEPAIDFTQYWRRGAKRMDTLSPSMAKRWLICGAITLVTASLSLLFCKSTAAPRAELLKAS